MTAEDLADDDENLNPEPWNWMYAASAALRFGGNLASAVGMFAEALSAQCVRAGMVRSDRQEAYASLHRDLEKL